jgi:hypothetical protein
VAVEAVDIAAHPERRAELAPLGSPRVPVTVVGERAVDGWNPGALAALVGATWAEPDRLSVPELAARLDRVLRVAAATVRQVPETRFGDTAIVGRDRPVRQLAYHVFRLSRAFPDSAAARRLPETWLNEDAPAALDTPAEVADYGDGVRRQLAAWFADPDLPRDPIVTYYGPQTAHELLERTVWHAAQHVRQLQAYLTGLAIPLADPLTPADLAGLPLPSSLA